MRPSSIPAPLSGSPTRRHSIERSSSTLPELIGERYVVRSLLGRGGMAAVYRVSDGDGGKEIALKQLQLEKDATNRAAIEALFEQEFCTLAQLDHPRVIRVYDYGWDPSGVYYTMELLDGGSLRESAPLPWREACALIHDVCSSLSLLHVRRLVHRDVTPSNVRRTLDGHAKLIDFGAMAAMGQSDQTIGTPPFSAPEVAQRLNLDARTDLFSLGATLYFALTARLAYPARTFAELTEAWATRPPAPSEMSSDIPTALDVLVMSMLSLEPALRPRSASEVMLQLATLVGRNDAEHADVSRAYMSTPNLVGRDELLLKFERRAARAHARAGSGLVIRGAAGMGRTRALDACALIGQTRRAVVTRVAASASGQQPFAAAQLLTEQLARALPQLCKTVASAEQIDEVLFEPSDSASDAAIVRRTLRPRPLTYANVERSKLHDALTRMWLSVARQRVIMIAVDDIDRLDEPSAAWLATLSAELKKHRLLLVCSARPMPREAHAALAVIGDHSAPYDLPSLGLEQVEQLLWSAFGDVPHVALLSDRVYRVANGSPRGCMDLARHLIERGTIKYEGGAWIMPTQLEMSELPRTMDEAMAARIAALSPQARGLADLLAISAYGGLSRNDCAQLTGVPDSQLEHALRELFELGVLACRDDIYAISDTTWASALDCTLSASEREARHRALGMFGEQTQRAVVATAYHLFGGGSAARAFEVLAPLTRMDAAWGVDGLSETTMSRDLICKVLSWDLSYAASHDCSEYEITNIRRWLCMLSMGADDVYYRMAAPHVLTTLRRESGLDDWAELAHIEDLGQRLTTALTRAGERYAAASEHERAYGVQDAIKHLIQYVVASIAIATRTMDSETLCALPGLLEPFAMLSPVIEAVYQNTLATRECVVQAHYHQARMRWQDVYDRLGNVPRDNLHYVDLIRSAILYGLGSLEAARGLPSATERAALLDRDPMQMVNALYLRRVMRLQQGDFEGAERFRRQAELRAVQLGSRQMFNTILLVELAAYGTARDLTAVREISARIAALAKTSAGWFTYQLIAEGCVDYLRGDLTAARQSLETALTQCWPGEPVRSVTAMPMASAMYIEVLIALEAYEQAREFGQRALAAAARFDIRTVDELERGLALAEAGLRDWPAATARLDAVIARQRTQGVEGLLLGTSYEARARIAIWAGDQAAFHEYGRLAALQYRHGRGSPLGARYERLISEARQAGVSMSTELTEFESMLGVTHATARGSARTLLNSAVRSAQSAEERAAAAAALLAEVTEAAATHLFLIDADSEVRWVASHPDRPDGDNALEVARQALERTLNDAYGATQIESDLEARAHDAPTLWNDRAGVPHRVQLLTSSSHSQPLYVAILVSNQGSLQGSPALLTAIAEHFLTSGDTEGFAPLAE